MYNKQDVEIAVTLPVDSEVYVYDGSYEGLLCCVFESVRAKKIPSAVYCECDFQPNLWDIHTIYTDSEKAMRVELSLYDKLGDDAAILVKTAFLSQEKEKELLILHFLHFAYKMGKRATKLLSHEVVQPMWKAYRNLHNEKHLLLGFTRFIDVGDALVGFIDPKNYVLPFIKEHFCTRLANENFLIFDRTHKAALVYKDGKAEICDMSSLEVPPLSEEEELFQALWKQFYKTIAIDERRNEKCRRSHMPMRYWKNMLEVREEMLAG